jgi:plastocyanin
LRNDVGERVLADPLPSVVLTSMAMKRVIVLVAGVSAWACNGNSTQPAGPPLDLLKSGGDAQNWYFNNRLPTPLSVTAIDVSGRPVPGVVVTWGVTSGGVNPAQSTTDAGGIATTIDSLGTSTTQTVSASFTGLQSAATFTEIGFASGSAVGVSVNNFVFAPRDTAVRIGGTVTWTWNSGTTQHNVTYTGGPSVPTSSSNQAGGTTFSTTFTTIGRYTYMCTLHPAQMTGSVTVVH